MNTFINTLIGKREVLWQLLIEHIQLTIIAVLISIIVGVCLGILISKHKNLAKWIMGIVNIVQAIPSLAILGFLIPLIGIGKRPAIFMTIIYAILPIIKNTYTALITIDSQMIEVAKGMGLTSGQILRKIKLPLAVPVIMAGIRIAAVTSVGLMTIAAFVGGGGLGYLVFSGIQTINTNLILLGAIPTAILALVIDCVVGVIEQSMTPEGTRIQNEEPYLKRRWVVGIFLVGAVLVMGQLFYSQAEVKPTIRIGSKLDTESSILGAMLCYLVEDKTDLKVEPKLKLGNTQILFEAIQRGDIDVCVDYTGTMLMSVLQKENTFGTSEEVYDYVKKAYEEKFGLGVLKPFGMNNTYAIGIREETKNKYQIETLSDLARIDDKLIAGTTIEFANRPDGLIGLQNEYNLNFKQIQPVDGSLRYIAIENNETDLIDVYATDAMVQQFNLVILKDEDNFFPPYYGVPIVRKTIAESYPELITCLDTLDGVLTDEVMRNLNYQVDIEKKDFEKVAYDFLLTHSYISGP